MKQMREERRQSTKVIRSAVYVLLLQGEVVYVGESQNVYTRLGNHIKDKGKRFDTIRILPCLEHRRHYWEAVLIYKYQPLFNKKGKNKETAKRHIHALSKIKEGQEKRPVSCKNCDARNSIYNHTGLSTANFHALERHRGVVTKACTTVGTITVETMPASDEEYIEILEEERKILEEERRREEKSKPRTIKIKVEHEIERLNQRISELRGLFPDAEEEIKKEIEEIKDQEYVEITYFPKDTTEEYIEILEDDKRRKKEKAWDNGVGYTEKIYNSLDIGFETSNPYRSTSVTDPQSLKKLFDTV